MTPTPTNTPYPTSTPYTYDYDYDYDYGYDDNAYGDDDYSLTYDSYDDYGSSSDYSSDSSSDDSSDEIVGDRWESSSSDESTSGDGWYSSSDDSADSDDSEYSDTYGSSDGLASDTGSYAEDAFDVGTELDSDADASSTADAMVGGDDETVTLSTESATGTPVGTQPSDDTGAPLAGLPFDVSIGAIDVPPAASLGASLVVLIVAGLARVFVRRKRPPEN